MADAFGGSGTTGGGFTGGDFVSQLLAMLGGLSGQAGGQYMNFVQNPTASPLYKNQLSGLLKSLEPGEQRAQTNLMDAFRNAGNMSSGAMGTATGNLQGELQRNRQVTASQLLGQMFPQMIAALQGPMNTSAGLVGALRNPQSSSSGGSGWDSIPPSLGLGTQMSSGTTPSTAIPPSLSTAPQTNNPYDQLLQLLMNQRRSSSGSSGGGSVYGDSGSSQPAYNPWAGFTAQDWANLAGE